MFKLKRIPGSSSQNLPLLSLFSSSGPTNPSKNEPRTPAISKYKILCPLEGTLLHLSVGLIAKSTQSRQILQTSPAEKLATTQALLSAFSVNVRPSKELLLPNAPNTPQNLPVHKSSKTPSSLSSIPGCFLK